MYQNYDVMIGFQFKLQNNRLDSIFNQKFDYDYRMQGLSF